MSAELEPVEDRLIVEVPRRNGEQVLRVRFVRAKTPQGTEVSWHDIREFFRGEDGEWKPGKKGITLRSRELSPVVEALVAELDAQGDGVEE